ncbi:MAG: HAD hydrolase-like protein [Lachnospiraceae bacterium]|nr:HAD hydrolase-like protein [Lachnospiraceae bacterium]
MWNTVLFDLDGTLTDSGLGITRCVQHALREVYGMEITELHDLDCFVGPPLKEQFLAFAGGTEEQAEQAVAVYRSRYKDTGIFENEVYPGIPELLRSLKEAHMTLALSSSKPTVFCKRILSYFGLDSYFTVILGSELDGRRTKKSEVVAEVLHSLGMEERRSEAVLIGDRNYDVEGARAAGIDCLAVSYGYGSRSELEAVWPACICDNVRELQNVLIGQLLDEQPAASGFPQDDFSGQTVFAGKAEQGISVEESGSPYAAGEAQRYARYAEPSGKRKSAGTSLRRDPWPLMIWRILYPYLISQAAAIIISFVLVILYSVFYASPEAIGWLDFIYDNDTIFGGFIDFFCLIILIPLFKSDENKRNHSRDRGAVLRRNRLTWKHVLMIVLATEAVSLSVNDVVSMIVYLMNPNYAEPQASFYTVSVFAQYVFIGVLTPICEELMFRGLIYRRIRDYFGPLPAIIAASVFFGLVHQDLPTDIIVFFGGIMLALAYEHFGSLKACIAGHMTINIFAITLNNYGEGLTNEAYYGFLLVLIVLGVFSIRQLYVKDRKVNYV